MSEHELELLADVLAEVKKLRGELRAVKANGIVARLSPAERHEVAVEVFEMVDERLAPPDVKRVDEAPRGRRHRGKFFER